MIVGIDPGTTGAICLYDPDEDEVRGVWDMPSKDREYGKGIQVDGEKLYDLLVMICDADTQIWIENVGSMPKQGVVSSFNFGHTVGTIYGVICALQLPRNVVHPVTWKKKFGVVGTGKYVVMEMIKQVYPETIKHLRLKKHHNRSDAIAIAIVGSML